jgi:exodeoxyribonuclease VII large subunit
MVKVLVQYHTLYGLSLNITDVEPAYTVGSMALQRRNTIAKLEADGVFEMNHELPLPTLLQRVAVISSEQAAGYQDFVQHLHDNEYGFGFSLTLFPSLMQGEKAVQDIMDALDRINTHKDAFDVVVIIRGGGATADLLCFDDYALASYVAQFPLPILTGIGHNKDESVVDMVAHQSLKTPTAVADFLVDQLTEEAAALDTYSNEISGIMQEILTRETRGLAVWQQQLISATTQRLQQENFALQLFAQSIESYHPYHILARGYAVARFRGKALTQASAVHPGDEVEVVLHKGSIHTVVQG